MASKTIYILFLASYFSFTTCSSIKTCPPIDIVYQFGDSTSDTGNLLLIVGNTTTLTAGRLPYGETYGKPTGRYSDGLLIIDYFTKALGLPLINPYLAKNVSFDHGINFAVAGSTVLNTSFYSARNVTIRNVIVPLAAQLSWFSTYLSSIRNSTTDCAEQLKKALIIVGEMGSNDFLYSFLAGKSIEEVRTYVPVVIAETINVTSELIKLGASRLVVFGNYPVGCSPIYLAVFKSENSSAYDDKGCLKAYNEFEIYRNNYLQTALAQLRKEFPQVTILYGDYYNGYQYVLRHASNLGFDPNSTLKACCGTGGSYNFNYSMSCGSTSAPVCSNPNEYIGWDGIHLTQAAYRHITEFAIAKISKDFLC